MFEPHNNTYFRPQYWQDQSEIEERWVTVPLRRRAPLLPDPINQRSYLLPDPINQSTSFFPRPIPFHGNLTPSTLLPTNCNEMRRAPLPPPPRFQSKIFFPTEKQLNNPPYIPHRSSRNNLRTNQQWDQAPTQRYNPKRQRSKPPGQYVDNSRFRVISTSKNKQPTHILHHEELANKQTNKQTNENNQIHPVNKHNYREPANKYIYKHPEHNQTQPVNAQNAQNDRVNNNNSENHQNNPWKRTNNNITQDHPLVEILFRIRQLRHHYENWASNIPSKVQHHLTELKQYLEQDLNPPRKDAPFLEGIRNITRLWDKQVQDHVVEHLNDKLEGYLNLLRLHESTQVDRILEAANRRIKNQLPHCRSGYSLQQFRTDMIRSPGVTPTDRYSTVSNDNRQSENTRKIELEKTSHRTGIVKFNENKRHSMTLNVDLNKKLLKNNIQSKSDDSAKINKTTIKDLTDNRDISSKIAKANEQIEINKLTENTSVAPEAKEQMRVSHHNYPMTTTTLHNRFNVLSEEKVIGEDVEGDEEVEGRSSLDEKESRILDPSNGYEKLLSPTLKTSVIHHLSATSNTSPTSNNEITSPKDAQTSDIFTFNEAVECFDTPLNRISMNSSSYIPSDSSHHTFPSTSPSSLISEDHLLDRSTTLSSDFSNNHIPKLSLTPTPSQLLVPDHTNPSNDSPPLDLILNVPFTPELWIVPREGNKNKILSWRLENPRHVQHLIVGDSNLRLCRAAPRGSEVHFFPGANLNHALQISQNLAANYRLYPRLKSAVFSFGINDRDYDVTRSAHLIARIRSNLLHAGVDLYFVGVPEVPTMTAVQRNNVRELNSVLKTPLKPNTKKGANKGPSYIALNFTVEIIPTDRCGIHFSQGTVDSLMRSIIDFLN